MSEKKQTLFGIPIVVTDVVTEGEAFMGRFPTVEEMEFYGSLEAAIEAQKRQWVKIRNLNTDHQ